MRSILLVLLLVTNHALVGQALEKRVAARYNVSTLAEVLEDLSLRHGLRFSYSRDLVQLDKKIDVSVSNVALRELLDVIFSQADVGYEFIGDQIVLKGSGGSYPLTINGKVIDGETNSPLALASVRLNGTGIGTATNDDGEFVLHVPAQHRDAGITVSFVGYKPRLIPVADMKRTTTLALQTDPTTLNAVVVTAASGISLLEEAIAKIHENYDTGAVRYTYFVLDRLVQDNEPIAAGEAEYQAYRGSAKAKDPHQIRAIKGRRVRDYNATQKILQTFPRWTGFDIGVDNGIIFSGDPAANRDENKFPGKGFLKKHNFELLGISSLDGQEVYVIDFDQKPAYRNRSLYSGKLYIDKETLAFRRIEMALSEMGIANAKFFGTSRAMALLFGYSKCSILEEKTILDYEPVNGKWYLNTAGITWVARLVKPRHDFASDVVLTGELVVTNIQADDALPLDSSKLLTSAEVSDWSYRYAPQFWNGHNTVPPDEQTQAMVSLIKDKNRMNGIDMNFWKRYQPYKSNPSRLIADSILTTQDPQDSAQATSAGDSYYKLPEPRYKPLTRTFSTAHFVVHHVPTDSSAARALAGVLEENYSNVLRVFDLNALSGPVHAEVYPDIESYHFAVGNSDAPASDVGMAVDDDRFRIVSPLNPGRYHSRSSILKAAVHEFAHCVHYQFIAQSTEAEKISMGNYDEAPWLFESMASYAAGQFYEPGRFDYLKAGHYPTLDKLNQVEDGGKVYDIGYIVVDFIQKRWGHDGLIRLVKNNGDIHSALGINTADFEDAFHSYMRDTYFSN